MRSTVLEQVVAGNAPGVLPLTVEQYHRMIELRILREGQPTEFIDGILVCKDHADVGGRPLSHGPRHALTLKRLQRTLRPAEDQGCHLHAQLPVTLAELQEPEPDLTVVRGGPEDFLTRHPGPEDIVAVMEVADSSLAYDRTTKLRLYSTAGLGVYWIVNLPEGKIEVYTQPLTAEGRYAVKTEFQAGQTLPLALNATDLVEVHGSDVLPPDGPRGV